MTEKNQNCNKNSQEKSCQKECKEKCLFKKIIKIFCKCPFKKVKKPIVASINLHGIIGKEGKIN